MRLVKTSPTPFGGVPEALEHTNKKNKWHTGELCGHITLAFWGVSKSSRQAKNLDVADKWAGWLHRFRRQGGVPKISKARYKD